MLDFKKTCNFLDMCVGVSWDHNWRCSVSQEVPTLWFLYSNSQNIKLISDVNLMCSYSFSGIQQYLD